ncbi:MAG: hypothetical protein IJ609_03155 [Paludibacteraceae bacterium]|nr:hypothetical protein [Paludibacteraceae bacterium]
MSAKRSLILTLVLVWAFGSLDAQYYNVTNKHARSYLTLSAGGGVHLQMGESERIKAAPGAAAQAAFSYEVQTRRFFFNIGVGADWNMLSPELKEMTDSYLRADRDGRPIRYDYSYSDYRETQQAVYASVPIQFGFLLTDNIYLALGVKASYPLYTHYAVSTDLYTGGTYLQLIEAVQRNVPSYGFYPEATYRYEGTYANAPLYVTPGFEAGALLPIGKRVSCRIGAYCEYGIPVPLNERTPDLDLIDYSAVDLSPQTQSQQNLQDNLRFNSLSDSHFNASVVDYGGTDAMQHVAQKLTVGVRCTFRFDVTPVVHTCMCLKY